MGEPRIMIAVDQAELAALRAEMAALRRAVEGVRMTPLPEWVTVPEYAARMGRSTKTVRNWIREGRLDSKREAGILVVRSV